MHRRGLCFMIMASFVFIAFQVMPVAASSSQASLTSHSYLGKNNSTEGAYEAISDHARGFLDGITDRTEDPSIQYNKSFDSTPPRESEDNETSLQYVVYREDLTPGEYMPDTSIARTTRKLWIDSPWDSSSYVQIMFAFSNPDEEYPRYFRVYLDGQTVYEEVFCTTRLADWFFCDLDDGLHEFTFEVRHGAYGKGWALEYAYIKNYEHNEMHTTAVLAKDEEMPQVYVSQMHKYVFIDDNANSFSKKVHVAVYSGDPYSRWLRIRVDDNEVFERVIYQSYETTIDVSAYVQHTDFYEITIEIKAGHYERWYLGYLAVEECKAKYIPRTLDLIVSFDWTPPTSYLDDFVAGLREFVDHAWNAFEEQLLIKRIDIYVDDQNWNIANIRCSEQNHFNPNAVMSYSIDGQGNPKKGTLRGMQIINLPKYWPHDVFTWTDWRGYLAITHELSHAFFHLADEGDGDVPSMECRSLWESASIMDLAQWPWPKTEFCVRINHDPDGDTHQTWWWWGWSCWETIVEFNDDFYEPFTVHDTTIDNVAADYVHIIQH